MTKDEYIKGKRDLERGMAECMRELNAKFAIENAIAQSGDLIVDHIGLVKVESRSITWSLDGFPTLSYYGLIYTKKGVPTKLKQNKRGVYHGNVISVNGANIKEVNNAEITT